MRWVAELYTTSASDTRPKEILVCADANDAVQVAEYIVGEMKRNPFTEVGRRITEANNYDPAEEAKGWNALPWYAKIGNMPDFPSAAASEKVAAYKMWKKMVGYGAKWDHKKAIRAMFEPKGTFRRGWQKYGQHDYYFDIWSNIHYGYVGTAIGFNAAELIKGAALAQIKQDLTNQIKDWELPALQNHPENGPWPDSADDIPDHISVQLGIDLYADVKPIALTADILLRKIVAVPLPWGTNDSKAKRLHRCDQ